MSIVNDVLEIIRDSKRIAEKPVGRRTSKLKLWRAYVRLRMTSSTNDGTAEFLGYRLDYFDAENLFQLFREIFVSRFYDITLGSDAPVIIDCGSNIGMSIVFFKNAYPHSRVIAFEPNPATFALLSRNVRQNGLRDVSLHQKALSDTPAPVEFFVNPNRPGALDVGLYAGRGMQRIQVEADQLSNYIDREIDLLKIDVEGAEELVLNDLAARGKLRRVRNIVCEYHHHHRRDDGDYLSRTLAILERAGFGYQLEAYRGRSDRQLFYQDVLIYAHRRDHGDGTQPS